MRAQYVNPFTDFGFKKIFGEPASKPILIDFLNALLPDARIVDLTFKNVEQLGITNIDRKAVYDLYCETSSGEKLIVELQKAKQNFFKDRTIFYATFPIQEQAERNDWNFELKAVYCIGILDFTFDDYESEPEKSDFYHEVSFKNQYGRVFYDKLKLIYLEMPNFNRQEHELKSRLDQWLYFIKHLEDFQAIPAIFHDQVFEKALQKASLAAMGRDEIFQYEMNLKAYRDLKNVVDTAFVEGEDVGFAKGMSSVAKSMKQAGEPLEKIIQYTGLTEDQIRKF